MARTKEPTQKEIVRAATNDPALSESSFTLGDRAFKLVDLPYEDYLKFLVLLKPLFGALRNSGIMGSLSFTDQPNVEAVTASSVLEYCANDLPEMVCIMCRQTDPNITIEEVKVLGKSPFRLASAVLAQMVQNQTISDLTDFFVQILPLLRMGKAAMGVMETKKTTEETPSS